MHQSAAPFQPSFEVVGECACALGLAFASRVGLLRRRASSRLGGRRNRLRRLLVLGFAIALQGALDLALPKGANELERITDIAGHLKDHAKDHHSRRGLVLMVGKRNRLLRYLARTEPSRYRELITRLGLRK